MAFYKLVCKFLHLTCYKTYYCSFVTTIVVNINLPCHLVIHVHPCGACIVHISPNYLKIIWDVHGGVPCYYVDLLHNKW